MAQSKRGGTAAKSAPAQGEFLSSTKVGHEFDLSSQKVNLVFAELGWIEKGQVGKGWIPTDQGTRRGAQAKVIKRTGIPYVVWPTAILENRVLSGTVQSLYGTPEEQNSEDPRSPAPTVNTPEAVEPGQLPGFRTRFPAKMRTADGHMVRSRGEAMIDNWLYAQNVVHAYERRLPIDEDVYCDFWLPKGRVYIEYWGLESQPTYAERMAKKKAIYAANGLKLIELLDDHITALDDHLPPMLRKYGIDTH